ncbi:hypothetical protein B0J12DRAFT_454934 [Macrophomina phaseolina]|uniref:Uncharacterized protein n=1 Tax=Macrophomina phaseolina TaxID=35725 RepID=A0ABQ8GID6_9PEZI|nr:hypothetical protein B0J12DRAFT_454934 [Macrophomina phaseolina]
MPARPRTSRVITMVIFLHSSTVPTHFMQPSNRIQKSPPNRLPLQSISHLPMKNWRKAGLLSAKVTLVFYPNNNNFPPEDHNNVFKLGPSHSHRTRPDQTPR